MQRKPPFRVKPYRHDKYKFVVRAKVLGRWERRYFRTEDEANDFARDQNAQFDRDSNGAQMSGDNGTASLTSQESPLSKLPGTDSEPSFRQATKQIAGSKAAGIAGGKTPDDLNNPLASSEATLGPVADHREVREAQTKTLQNAIAEAYARLAQLVSDLEAERSRSREYLDQVQEQASQRAALQSAVEQARAESLRLSSELEDVSLERRELQAQTEVDARQIKALSAEVHDHRMQREVMDRAVQALRTAIEEARAESTQLSAKLETESAGRSADRERLQSLEQTIPELRRTEEELSKSRRRIEHLFTALKIWQTNRTGLERYHFILKRRLENVSRGLFKAGAALRQGDAENPSVIDSISEDIRQISHPSIWWKLASGLGLMRLAQPGVPRTAADRRTLASQLKTVLRGLRKTLSAKRPPPEETVIEINRLFQLRRVTQEFVRSVDLWRLFRFQAPSWSLMDWSRPSAAAVSAGTPAAVLFDAPWYLAQYSDVAASGDDPLTHYLKWGAREGRNPNAIFDTDWYLVQNPDVALAELNPLEHYVQDGAREGRDPSPLFSTRWYLAQNQDVAAAEVNPLQHYLEFGVAEKRDPHPLFDSTYYLEQHPEVAGLNPVEYYLNSDVSSTDSPHPLFDAAWYLAQNSDISQAGRNPLLHYLDRGWREARDPNPLFNTAWYISENPDLTLSGENPLVHYRVKGGKAERDPHPVFDSKYYISQDPNTARTGLTPLEHYLLFGAKAGRTTHPLFDAKYYRDTYLKDVTEWVDPVQHYLAVGWELGYRPNPSFDPRFYLHVHRDVAEARQEPFGHYLRSGRAEKRITTTEALSFELRQPEFKIPREPALVAPPTPSDVKAIAFYLPQFHSIPQNDLWWGEGFTEWTNVRRGTPNFAGHYQPHVPAGLGYYDLSSEGVLEKQAELARTAGLHGFCFYYYWFGGEVLLDLPVRRMVETGKPDFPFCICWANENWTRRWDGKDDDILIAQRHSAEDDFAFISHVEKIIRSKNYIRIAGNPILLVYRPSLLPDAKATLQRWRTHVRDAGLGELHLVMVQSFSEGISPADYGFDAAVQFPPHFPSTPVTPVIEGKASHFTGYIYDYDELRQGATRQLRSVSPGLTLYPGVMPSWDNTARQRGKSSIWVNSSPEAYSEWLAEAISLARAKLSLEERFVFINAWNEWAEGCHLEPDEHFGYAWLNATSLAQRQSSLAPAISLGLMSHPEPPAEAPILVQPLTGPVKLVISVLLYHREDILTAFVEKLLPQVKVATEAKDLSCELFLSFNYQPSSEALEELRHLISRILPHSSCVHIIENHFNLGFGAGHNAIFEKTDSDVFFILNSDLHFEDEHWLTKFIDRFRDSDAAILGLAENASRLREDGCGIPVGETGAPLDFVDGSVLAIRSGLARQFGLFSPSFDYFYFEDVDLNLRYRQMGLRIETLDIPCLHERSSSTRLLPKFAVESVLNQNRARFFERWGGYLTTRCLTNRLALQFQEADRQLQCASFPAIFGLLAEHPTAVLDLRGLHEQLVPLFQHPRIRLIPWWQTPRREDYLRRYELSLDAANASPLAVRIAEQILVDPAFELARRHLESLVSRGALEHKQTKGAVIYLARPQVLFEGRQPEADSLLAAQEPLFERDFAVQCFSEYGVMEVPAVPERERRKWKYVARSSGLDLLTDLAWAEVLVTSDGWAAELGQLLNKKTLVWLGATSASVALWNVESARAFFDPALSCLGCHERFGQPGRNVCLRGDQACLNSGLTHSFVETVGKFLDDEGAVTAAPKLSSIRSIVTRSKPSEQEKLEAWPQTSAGSVLILTPVNPTLDPAVIRRARELAERAINGMRGCRIVYDETGEAPLRGQPHPHRQAAIAEIRQNMIDRHLRDERWVFWVDADLVAYPANLVEELISRAEGGIAAPLVLMEGDLSQPAYLAGFGPGRFYDIAGFIEKGRWARFVRPYFDQIGPVYQLDSVGSCYLINADLYRAGARHTVDRATNQFISSKSQWSTDAIHQNQIGPANSYTEHYSVCEFTREAGLPVRAFADLIAYHQKA